MYVHVTSPRDLNYFNQNSALSKTFQIMVLKVFICLNQL